MRHEKETKTVVGGRNKAFLANLDNLKAQLKEIQEKRAQLK